MHYIVEAQRAFAPLLLKGLKIEGVVLHIEAGLRQRDQYFYDIITLMTDGSSHLLAYHCSTGNHVDGQSRSAIIQCLRFHI